VRFLSPQSKGGVTTTIRPSVLPSQRKNSVSAIFLIVRQQYYGNSPATIPATVTPSTITHPVSLPSDRQVCYSGSSRAGRRPGLHTYP
jgi:hypothetical protein